jgi:hypothetical protein
LLRTVQKADEDQALVHLAHLVPGGLGDLDDHVGLAVERPGVSDDPRPGLLVALIQVVVAARPGLDEHLEALPDQLPNGLGDQPDPILTLRYLPRYSYFHAEDYSRESGIALLQHASGGNRYQQSPVL